MKTAGLCRQHDMSIKKTGSTTTVEPVKKERRDEEYSIYSRYHANLKKQSQIKNNYSITTC